MLLVVSYTICFFHALVRTVSTFGNRMKLGWGLVKWGWGLVKWGFGLNDDKVLGLNECGSIIKPIF